MLSEHRELLYSLCRKQQIGDFLSLITRTSYTLCSDPRDRVFALISMLKDEERHHSMLPDYYKTTSEVYQDICIYHISRTKRLSLLTTVDTHKVLKALPSWVPDVSQYF